ncbi:hypothetical protein POV27_02105 [Aureisphaera galaxeae]|uniref:hypothetical protein n=1 Tax=Aureisphaera galaxeae TaxID=1538023 RepID=UPI00234FBF44|nr:hypothetical protein [Aureisphaera galaxeae]MDC8002834.1 hypothetical protein [Aureisphaera galaxeae]
MKTLLFSLAFLTATVAGFAQNTPGNEVTSVMNLDYMNAVQQKSESTSIGELQQQVASWDVRKQKEFDRRQDLFTVVFKSENGNIEATFDKNGEIYSTSETYTNMVLPKKIHRKVMEQFPGWEVVKSKQILTYKRSQEPEVCYSLKLTQGSKRKTIRLNEKSEKI